MGARAAPAMPLLSSAAPCGRSLNVGLAHPPCLVGHAKAAAPAARAVAAKARLTAQKSASCCIQSLMRDGSGHQAQQWLWPCCLHTIAWMQGAKLRMSRVSIARASP